MRRGVAVIALLPSLACAQAPGPERLEGCHDALLASGEQYRIASSSGSSQALDWIGCLASGAAYTAGAAHYDVAGSRWNIGRGSYATQWGEDRWLAADLAAGSGRNAGGSFDYFTLRDSFTWRFAARWFARLEHQYVDIASDHGNLVKAAASTLVGKNLLLELAGTRSIGGNLGTRGVSGRAEWVDGAGRWYAGVAHVRATPQAVDLITGARPPNAVTREAFLGGALTFAWGELHAAYDEQRTASIRRRTLSAALRWTFR